MSREGKSHVIAVAFRSADARKAARSRQQAGRALHGRPARPEGRWHRAAQSGRFDGRAEALARHGSTQAEAELAAFRARRGRRGETLGADPGEIAGLDASWSPPTVARAGKEATLERVRQLVESGDVTTATGELGSSPLLDNLLALKAELLRREAELDGQYGQRHPKILAVRAEQDKLDGRIREEREALLRQYEGELARARAGERLLAGKLEELKGKALRREADGGRTAELEREVELSRRLYEAYLARASTEERRLAAVEPDARRHLRGRGTGRAELSQAAADPVPGADRRVPARASPPCTWPRPASAACARSARWREVLGLPTLALVPRLDGPGAPASPPRTTCWSGRARATPRRCARC